MLSGVKAWHTYMAGCAPARLCSILICNKVEKLGTSPWAAIGKADGERLAKDLRIDFVAASAKVNIGVSEIFDILAR